MTRCLCCGKFFDVNEDKRKYNLFFESILEYDYICQGEVCSDCGIREALDCLKVEDVQPSMSIMACC